MLKFAMNEIKKEKRVNEVSLNLKFVLKSSFNLSKTKTNKSIPLKDTQCFLFPLMKTTSIVAEINIIFEFSKRLFLFYIFQTI